MGSIFLRSSLAQLLRISPSRKNISQTNFFLRALFHSNRPAMLLNHSRSMKDSASQMKISFRSCWGIHDKCIDTHLNNDSCSGAQSLSVAGRILSSTGHCLHGSEGIKNMQRN
uniref:Uncharacterized protein n=1 Tax=Phaeodactylum tricornutum TaxID=2850 RepID=A0A8J9X3E3_PHATR